MPDKNAFLRLWGKTNRPQNTTYHPLLFHLYDVAYSAAELWEVLPVGLKQRMANALELEIEAAGRLFVMLAGLHDLGKANPKFQSKAQYLLASLQNADFDFPADLLDHPHNFVSVPEVERLFASNRLFPHAISPDLSRLFAYALGAHHGVFPHADALAPIQGRTLGVRPEWEEARNWLANQLKAGLPDVETSAPSANLPAVTDAAFAPLLAALISLADWFGSSKHFVMQGAQDIVRYRETSQQSAATALQKSGWTPPPAPPAPAEFAQMFAYLDETNPIAPNALQRKVLEQLDSIHGPALWILEEEMGAGKTEAAFAIFDHARVHGLAHGTYLAMPTQATSNAMHDRLGTFLRHRNPSERLNLILAHSHATLDEDYRKRIEIGENFTAPIYNEETQAEKGALLVRAWFTHSKQTLLAHYGVGTIDQALLGVLQTRHWFVRLFGLAGKVIVFDEVHAYDSYMNTLLFRLIEWLAELDCTVVLLSATLPRPTRLALADAYAKGAKTPLGAPENLTPYPRITLVQKGKPASACAMQVFKDPAPEPKRVMLSHLPNTPAAVQSALLAAIPGDGCAIVICNTVARAQQMYAELKAELSEQGWTCLLFHARTPFKWRKEKEDRVLELFGKESGEKRTRPRSKTLLVATQVVEQSLDLDADFMASEIAPVDLILQRMGRLWRHSRARTATETRFALLYDCDVQTGLPDFGKSAFVYAEHTLLRSWFVLKDRPQILLAEDIEPLVAAVYDAPDPTDLPEGTRQVLQIAWIKLRNEIMNSENTAEQVIIKEPCLPRYLFNQPNRKLNEEDNPSVDAAIRAATRLSDVNVRIICIGTGKQNEVLAPDHEYPKTPEDVRSLMEFEVNITSGHLVHEIMKILRPQGWQKQSHLRFHFPVRFESGVAKVGEADNITLELDEEFGLREGKRK